MLPQRRMTILESNQLRLKVCELKQFWQNLLKLRNTFGDKIEIKDEIFVWEGEGKNRKLKFKSKGHIVNQGLIWLINLSATSGTGYAGTVNYYNFFGSYNFTPSGNSYIRLGTGGNTTVATTTALTTPNSTVPSSQAGTTSNPSAGVYRVSWTATWNAGSIAALVITEMGLWLAIGSYTSLQSFAFQFPINSTITQTAQFFSRLSEADGDFTHFTINTSVPLTIEWRLTYSFA
jgi:hypothetical protein